VPNWAEDLYDCDAWGDVEADPIPANSLVFAGNIGRAQGVEALVEAAEITRAGAPSAHWVFVGDGTLREWLENQIRGRSLTKQFTLLPRRPPEDMPKILKPAAALLVSLGSDEVLAHTIPSKVQSCLAAGRPVIGALAGQSARVIDEAQCGMVCRPDDATALAAAVKRLLELPPEQRDRLGRSGHAYYKAHFTQSRVVGLVLALLNEMTGRGRS
jgi:colanic acid biosynthesis glycosyl transferase WcaI